MTELITGLAVASLAAVGLAGCSADDGGGDANGGAVEAPEFAEGSMMAQFAEAGTIRIGTRFDQPLFGLADASGTPSGFDVEMGVLIAEELGIPRDRIEWVETTSQNREPFIQNSTVDLVVANYTINDARKEVIDFAGPYYVAGQSLLVPEGNSAGLTTDVDSLAEQLEGLTVCATIGSTPNEKIREFTDDVLNVDKTTDCIEPLRTGQADAMTTDNAILAGISAQNPGEFEVVPGAFTEEPYGIGLPKDNEEFRNWINDVLEAAYEDGRWQAAWEATIGDELEMPEPPAPERY
ncbi:MAG: glutamate ABC transporter substrate-binding protein [Microbacteriaceae bacterium]|nr:glutamate ABC transporter substrate-binding protein [Microbacteriaceae bacterium]